MLFEYSEIDLGTSNFGSEILFLFFQYQEDRGSIFKCTRSLDGLLLATNTFEQVCKEMILRMMEVKRTIMIALIACSLLVIIILWQKTGDTIQVQHFIGHRVKKGFDG